ncbi:class I adenylate-forming enzyme family protein [Rivihabitans pingtungensis]|uniref:Long-chain acyl-CoA synthetase n=1 Tax=Rivihabitans pingtungensis TaxID=1054498 RepID=A0A318LC82_9NEIS|nr:class I adenylate-forming enzyme family protein [Rivihabitans pingtungensis]PXX79237.1 long-chain acyl-CoA synthetase [Rivihabitans pingtungensis]
MSTLIAHFDAMALRHGDKPALIQEHRQISYGQLREASERLAQALSEAGLRAGAHIALDGVNEIEFVIAYLAIARMGACLAPIDSRLSLPEVDVLLADFQPGACLLLDEGSPLSQAMQARSDWQVLSLSGPDEPAVTLWLDPLRCHATPAQAGDLVVQYSSGSTGKPKGIILSRDNIFHKVNNWNITLDISDKDVFLCTLTLSHCYGMYVHTLAGLLAGAVVHLPRLAGLTPGRILRMLADWQVTVFGSLPYMYQLWLAVPAERVRLDSVRYLISGSAPLPEVTARAFHDTFGRNLNQVYGLTEIGLITFNKHGNNPMSLGWPTANMVCRVVDESGQECAVDQPGELLVRCASMARGYLDNPEEAREMFRDGWLHTKDVVRRAADGSFVMCGRLSQFINVGGNKVSPAEVENTLLAHPAIKEAAVVGQRGAAGEDVVAFIVRQPGQPHLEPRDVFQYCAEALSGYKRPRVVHIIDALPKSPLGKVLKAQLFTCLG